MLATQTDPWQVRFGDFPATAAPRRKLAHLVHYAVLAPSSHNTQPWLFRVTKDALELFADRTRALPVVDPHDRSMVISCGAALYHVRIALHEFGYRGMVMPMPAREDDDLLAAVRLGDSAAPDKVEMRMFRAIAKRRTTRTTFAPDPVPESLLRELQHAAELEGAWLQVVHDEKTRHEVADLIAEGDRIQLGNPSFRRELAKWIHPVRSKSRDGIPGYAFGMPQLLDFATPAFAFVLRTFDVGKGRGASDRRLAEHSPALMVLGTDQDRPRSWLTAGQALARVLLRACADGYQASYLNQPIEVADLRPRLAALLGRGGSHPQILLRMGKAQGKELPHTPRRPIREVLEESA
ncbi:MAG: nitroreductase family protein [Planctomycetes bacterium]|nr:nitroreductase family protein [Planctomycetota bacterium]